MFRALYKQGEPNIREQNSSAKQAHRQEGEGKTLERKWKRNRDPEWFPKKICLTKATTSDNIANGRGGNDEDRRQEDSA